MAVGEAVVVVGKTVVVAGKAVVANGTDLDFGDMVVLAVQQGTLDNFA